nr:T9SS type A sorting domain-containing protein [Melioribacteraceae bacterium]
EKEYSQFPFKLQIENSGIYSIASFDIDNEAILFSSFTKAGIYEFKNEKFSLQSTIQKSGNDFVAGVDVQNTQLRKADTEYSHKETILFKKNFLNGKSILNDNGGNIKGTNGEEITISVPNRNQLIITSNLAELKDEIVFEFPRNLACADLIGIDKSGNIYVVIETYLSEIPLKVEREVYTISPSGNILTRLLLPNIKYLYTLKDLQIDEDGNLYHLLSYTDKAVIVKWDDLTVPTKWIVKYSDEYYENIHFNDFVTTTEITTNLSKNISGVQSGVSRTEALKIADTYVLHQYECSSSNLAPSGITAPDGDEIQTPDWLIVGMNARVPYKWGGFNTIAQFDAGLANGRYAGDINTDGVSPNYAYGVDCSGYVSRCWQLSYQANTAYMPNITTQYASWDDLKPGDAIHKVGHVRLFVERNVNGSLKFVEAAGRGWGVSYYSYLASDMSSYTPRYYNNMEDNYNDQRPTLISAEFESENLVALNWNCDTDGILGYRVYISQDGDLWNTILDENNCKTTFAEINISDSVNYFRVSSVKNDSVDFSESNWSNVLGVSNTDSEKRALIVAGFEREGGSWRGAGHTFVLKYGKALDTLDVSFNSIQNSELQNGLFQLEDYDYVFWIIGDESTVDETFNPTEQSLVSEYLERGGSFFVSGSEIGWDLDNKGTDKDKDFYNNYLKANFISDDAEYPTFASGIESTALAECSLNFGQTYEEDYPDEIEAQNGSSLCMKYSNGRGAGVEYNGQFGNTNLTDIKGNLIYLAFPLETTANDTLFNQVISNVVTFFRNNPTSITNNSQIITEYKLEQNYPNPFNPSTTIHYSIPVETRRGVSQQTILKIYDILGNEVATLVNENQQSGNYEVSFNASNLSSGIFFYKLVSGNFIDIKKMIFLK